MKRNKITKDERRSFLNLIDTLKRSREMYKEKYLNLENTIAQKDLKIEALEVLNKILSEIVKACEIKLEHTKSEAIDEFIETSTYFAHFSKDLSCCVLPFRDMEEIKKECLRDKGAKCKEWNIDFGNM
jgi:hypothetical protein